MSVADMGSGLGIRTDKSFVLRSRFAWTHQSSASHSRHVRHMRARIEPDRCAPTFGARRAKHTPSEASPQCYGLALETASIASSATRERSQRKSFKLPAGIFTHFAGPASPKPSTVSAALNI